MDDNRKLVQSPNGFQIQKPSSVKKCVKLVWEENIRNLLLQSTRTKIRKIPENVMAKISSLTLQPDGGVSTSRRTRVNSQSGSWRGPQPAWWLKKVRAALVREETLRSKQEQQPVCAITVNHGGETWKQMDWWVLTQPDTSLRIFYGQLSRRTSTHTRPWPPALKRYEMQLLGKHIYTNTAVRDTGH